MTQTNWKKNKKRGTTRYKQTQGTFKRGTSGFKTNTHPPKLTIDSLRGLSVLEAVARDKDVSIVNMQDRNNVIHKFVDQGIIDKSAKLFLERIRESEFFGDAKEIEGFDDAEVFYARIILAKEHLYTLKSLTVKDCNHDVCKELRQAWMDCKDTPYCSELKDKLNSNSSPIEVVEILAKKSFADYIYSKFFFDKRSLLDEGLVNETNLNLYKMIDLTNDVFKCTGVDLVEEKVCNALRNVLKHQLKQELSGNSSETLKEYASQYLDLKKICKDYGKFYLSNYGQLLHQLISSYIKVRPLQENSTWKELLQIQVKKLLDLQKNTYLDTLLNSLMDLNRTVTREIKYETSEQLSLCRKNFFRFQIGALDFLQSVQEKLAEFEKIDVEKMSNKEVREALQKRKENFAKMISALQMQYLQLQKDCENLNISSNDAKETMKVVASKYNELREAESDLYTRAMVRLRFLEQQVEDFHQQAKDCIQKLLRFDLDANASQETLDALLKVRDSLDVEILEERAATDLETLRPMQAVVCFQDCGKISEELNVILVEESQRTDYLEKQYCRRQVQ